MLISRFDLWPLISEKLKIPSHSLFAYGPKDHSCPFIALSYWNCRKSSRKYKTMAVPVEPKTDQPRNHITFFKMHLIYHSYFVKIGLWSKLGHGRTRWHNRQGYIWVRSPVIINISWNSSFSYICIQDK